jgi:gliding motility-associated-like protein
MLMGQRGVQTENELGAEDLVKNVFIKGNCRNATNITTKGNENLSIGQFSNARGIIGFEEGIILSTGDIELAEGPNNDNESTRSFGIESNDSDLRRLATSTLYDVTAIEFDFIPIDNRVTFRYVFASEEFCEFVTTSFNDVFGFFVSGPGINGIHTDGAINLATLEATNEPVSINTVNHIDNNNLYVNNATTADVQNCEIEFNDEFLNLIDYDGFTIPLSATFDVIPCETYHMRLIIGDVSDDKLDSAVFLEAKSFNIGEPITVTAEVPGLEDPIAYEGCVDGQFVFSRGPGSSTQQDLVIDYSISSDSEAINGVDFEEIPMSITIPAGQSSFVLPITVIEDGIIEGPENLKLELVYDCDCIDPTVSELIITEDSNLSLNFNDILVCAEQPFELFPFISGGVPPYNYLWENGEQSDTLITSITAPITIGLSITDFCGNTGQAVANVGLQSVPRAILSGTYDICQTIDTGIPVELEGNPPWSFSYSMDGVPIDTFENVMSSPFIIPAPVIGTYTLDHFTDAFCTGNLVNSAVVETPFSIEGEITQPRCFNSSDGSIRLTRVIAIEPFTLQWDVQTEDDLFLDELKQGTYTLTIIDGDGCIHEETFEVEGLSDDPRDCVQFYIPNVFSPNNDGINDDFLIFVAEDSGIQSVTSFQVYDRWGNLIFNQGRFIPQNGNIGWDGFFKGEPLDPNVYFYKMNLAFIDGGTLTVSGDVTLVR